jgi:hypothetical protein
MRLTRYRPSPATAIATLALVVAGAGVGTAASGLISGSKIKPGTITGRQIKNHSIGLNKLNGNLPAGPRGPAGPITGALPAGVTLRGWFDLDAVAAAPGQVTGGSISFGLSLSTPPIVTIVPVFGPATTLCPGSVSAPKAARGYLCLYESSIHNTPDINHITAAFGTELFIDATAAGRFYVDGTWAVTG